jgi:hypothetical protein
VGLYYEAFRAHFLNLGEPALTSTPMDRNPQEGPIYSPQSSQHTSSVGWGSQLNWEWGLESNTIYCTDNVVRNLLCPTGNTLSLVEQDAVPQVGTGTLPSIHITTVTGGIISATSRWPPTPPREVWLSYTQKKPKLVKLHRKD